MSITAHQTRLAQILSAHPKVPVVALKSMDLLPRLLQKLDQMEISLAEITLRTDCGLEAIASIKAQRPDFVVAAGTVLDASQLEAASAAGADFIVTPGFLPHLSELAVKLDIPLLPGVMTPSEVMLARCHGHRIMKLFPAQTAGGVGMLKDLAGPFADVQFCPTGGIGEADMEAFFTLPNVIAVGASWLGKV